MNEKALEVFNELLEDWYWANHAFIFENSSNISKEHEELELRKKEFQNKFEDAFNL